MTENRINIDAIEKSLTESDFTGIITRDRPLAPLTSYGIGGPAALFITVNKASDIVTVKKILSEHNTLPLVIGGGSNLLVADTGYDGAVMQMSGDFEKLEIDGLYFYAGASVPISKLVNHGCSAGFKGIERLAGIPGWVGGAIFMNAGTFGEHIDGLITDIEIMTPDSDIDHVTPDECEFDYRSSRFQTSGELILSCSLKMKGEPGDPDELKAEIDRRLNRRQCTQPITLQSCGSVFRNPPDHKAAILIDEAGLKGTRHGNAAISDLHANFITNLGGASADDVIYLMALARQTVFHRTGIVLVPEVRAVGFASPLDTILDNRDLD